MLTQSYVDVPCVFELGVRFCFFTPEHFFELQKYNVSVYNSP